MRNPVELSAELFLAEGSNRKCFKHPVEAQRCIKILHPHRRPGLFWREIAYFNALSRRGVNFEHIAAFHGLVDTNLGRGAVFDLVRDDDGQVSKSLQFYLRQRDAEINAWIVDEMENLRQDLYRQCIAVHNLNPNNILAKRVGFNHYCLVVIDGIGHNHWIPLANFSRLWARQKLTRVWNQRYHQWYAAYPAVAAQLKTYLLD